MAWKSRVLLIGGLVMFAFGARAGERDEALRIIEASGIRGGVVVHVHCGDGRLTSALRISDAHLVHGLGTDRENIATARRHIESLGLYGPVSADTFDGNSLPYVDNMVNLLVAERLGQVPEAEVLRVLAPNGVANVKMAGGWTKTVKPRPNAIDEWTHYLHGPDNNAVAEDSIVGPPRRLQWQGGPKRTRHHDHMSSLSALVSSGGQLFYILDEGRRPSHGVRAGRRHGQHALAIHGRGARRLAADLVRGSRAIRFCRWACLLLACRRWSTHLAVSGCSGRPPDRLL